MAFRLCSCPQVSFVWLCDVFAFLCFLCVTLLFAAVPGSSVQEGWCVPYGEDKEGYGSVCCAGAGQGAVGPDPHSAETINCLSIEMHVKHGYVFIGW